MYALLHIEVDFILFWYRLLKWRRDMTSHERFICSGGKKNKTSCLRQLSVDLVKAVKQGFVKEVLPCVSIGGWKVAENCTSMLPVHGHDDAHCQLSNRRGAVLQRHCTELTEEEKACEYRAVMLCDRMLIDWLVLVFKPASSSVSLSRWTQETLTGKERCFFFVLDMKLIWK